MPRNSQNALTRLKIVPRKTQAQAALDGFLLDARARRLSPRTVEYYRQQLTAALGFLAARNATALEEITPQLLREYLVSLQDRNLTDNSIHAAARALRAWLNWCIAEKLLKSSPMVKMPTRAKRILPAFEEADVDRLLAAVKDDARNTAILLALLDTGLRAAEFVALDLVDVNLLTGVVTVRDGKGAKDRIVYLGPRSRRAVRRLVMDLPDSDADSPLWRSATTGERLTANGLRELLRRIGKRAGVAHAHPHTFRRTFALWSLRSGMNIYALQQLMGHADLSVLRQYLALVEKDLAEAHREHGPVESLLGKGKGRR